MSPLQAIPAEGAISGTYAGPIDKVLQGLRDRSPMPSVHEYGDVGVGGNDTQTFIDALLDQPSWGGITTKPGKTYLVEPDAIRVWNHKSIVCEGGLGVSKIKALSSGSKLIRVDKDDPGVSNIGSSGLIWEGVLRGIWLDGSYLANWLVYLMDGTSHGALSCLKLSGQVNNAGTGLGRAIENENHAFTFLYDRLFAWDNDRNGFWRGTCQNSVWDLCQFFAAYDENLRVGDGTSRVGRLVFQNCDWERANFGYSKPGFSGDVSGMTLNWVDPIEIRSVYNESHTTPGSLDLKVVGGHPCRILIDGQYSLGSRQATSSIVLPGDDTVVHLGLKNQYLVDFEIPIVNADKPNKFIYDEAGLLNFTTYKDFHFLKANRLSTPAGGFGKMENKLLYSEDMNQPAVWVPGAPAGALPTVDSDVKPNPFNVGTLADALNFLSKPGRFTQHVGLNFDGKTMCFSGWACGDGVGGLFEPYLFGPGASNAQVAQFFHVHPWPFWRPFFVVLTCVGNADLYARISADSAIDISRLFVWGMQVEENRGPGVYVKTTNAPVGATGGFYVHPDARWGIGKPPTATDTVTGSRGGNAAVASLITKLADKGIIIDGTSA